MKTKENKTIKFSDYFESKKRDNGENFYCLKDNRPDHLQELCREAHGDMLPDDYKYEMIHDAFCHLETYIEEGGDLNETGDDAHEFADGAVSVYNTARAAWLASHLDRGQYVNDAIEEFDGKGTDIYNIIAWGWYREAEEVYNHVADYLRKQRGE